MSKNIATESMEYENLFAGEVTGIMPVAIAKSQTIKKGDLLIAAGTDGAVAATFSKATAGAALGNVYAVALEDVTTTSSAFGKANAALAGYFNADEVGLPASSTEGNRYALAAQGIYLI